MRGTDDDTMVGQVVEERYRIEETLGRGAMGTVYRARHVQIGREVAIKMLHDHLVTDATMVARFEREAALAARLDHANVVSVIDVGEGLMVLELARGETLAAIVGRGPMAPERVVELTTQLLRGLEHAHDMGLVHRDLKPENVIIEHDDHGREVPRIVDFGIAVLRDGCSEEGATRRLTECGTVLGTPPYMAPEQAYGDAPDPRTDLFALGVMVYEMLAGVQPFDGTGVEVILCNIGKDPPSIRRRAGFDVDPWLEAFARKLMARRLPDRFASAAAALATLALITTDREGARVQLDLRMRRRSAWPALTVPMPVATPRSTAPTMPVVIAPTPTTAPVRRSARSPLIRWAAAVAVLALGAVIGWRIAAPRAEIQVAQVALPIATP
jgi:serine/threonine protein kinase